MASSKISEHCFIICLLGLTSVTYVTLGDSGIAEKHRFRWRKRQIKRLEVVDQSTLLFSFSFIYFTNVLSHNIKYTVYNFAVVYHIIM